MIHDCLIFHSNTISLLWIAVQSFTFTRAGECLYWKIKAICLPGSFRFCVYFFFFASPSSAFIVPLPFPYSDISERQRPHQKREVRIQTKIHWMPLRTRCNGCPVQYADEMLIVTPVITRLFPLRTQFAYTARAALLILTQDSAWCALDEIINHPEMSATSDWWHFHTAQAPPPTTFL